MSGYAVIDLETGLSPKGVLSLTASAGAVYRFRLIPASFVTVQYKPDPPNQPGPIFPWQVTARAGLVCWSHHRQ